MMVRLFGRVLGAAVLLVALWGLSAVPHQSADSWIRPLGGAPGPVRILRFYATTGSIEPGDKAELCYGVENAKAVRILPAVAQIAPSANRCLEIAPDHTTHYTIMAEGFDGIVVMRPLTLVVQSAPAPPQERVNLAGYFGAAKAL